MRVRRAVVVVVAALGHGSLLSTYKHLAEEGLGRANDENAREELLPCVNLENVTSSRGEGRLKGLIGTAEALVVAE